ncbi:MAG: hypothetical protein Q7S78_01685 [Candidatus Azambacteria bacterium]|nr:hypothetical protein [Candidatus Azambacteria bacterium]
MENKDYLIPEFEEKLKKAEELRKKIDNPEPGRLLSTHRKLEEEYNLIFTEKVRLYGAAKKIIEKGFKLFVITISNRLCYVHSYSAAWHPEVCYVDGGRFTIPIATSRHAPFVELSPEEFMARLVAGNYSSFQ